MRFTMVLVVAATLAGCAGASGGDVKIQTHAPLASGELCAAVRLGGVLTADSTWGLAITADDGLHGVVWPNGWSARRESNRVVLVDRAGEVVAGQGDEIKMEGVTRADGVEVPCDPPNLQVVAAAHT